MKELTRPFFAWFVSLFNVGMYNFNLSDDIDSLILLLRLNGIKYQANELVRLYELVECNQQTLIFLDVFKCLFMLLSVLFLFILNQDRISTFFRTAYLKTKQLYRFFKNKFKAK